MRQLGSWTRLAIFGAVLVGATVVFVVGKRPTTTRRPQQVLDEEVWGI
jgi:hypothetical protein